MKIKLISVGKIKNDYLKIGINDYIKRIMPYYVITVLEIEDERIPFNASKKEEEKVKEIEGIKILDKIGKDDYVLVFDVQGKEYDSLEFARKLEHLIDYGKETITLVIGGSLGISENVKKRAQEKISLSKMTFPHQLARLIILEQIYRACKIIRNEIYHK